MRRSVLAGPAGHPFHPFVVSLPIGAFVSSLIFDILTRTRADGLPYLVDGAFWLIGALIAALPGLADLVTIPRRSATFRAALVHVTLNVSAAILFVIGYVWRAGDHLELDKTRWGAARVERRRRGGPDRRHLDGAAPDLPPRHAGPTPPRPARQPGPRP